MEQISSILQKNSIKPPKRYVDDRLGVSLHDFGRGLLRATNGAYKSGIARIDDVPGAKMSYNVSRGVSGAYILTFTVIGTAETFDVRLAGIKSTFGMRPLLCCPGCGSRRFKLFFSHVKFLCRDCMCLRYESRDYNQPIFKLFLRQKRMDRKFAHVKRPIYGVRFTRKARAAMQEMKAVQSIVQSHTISRDGRLVRVGVDQNGEGC